MRRLLFTALLAAIGLTTAACGGTNATAQPAAATAPASQPSAAHSATATAKTPAPTASRPATPIAGPGSCSAAVKWYEANADTVTNLRDVWSEFNSSHDNLGQLTSFTAQAVQLPPIPFAAKEADWKSALTQLQSGLSHNDESLIHQGGVAVDELYQWLLTSSTEGCF